MALGRRLSQVAAATVAALGVAACGPDLAQVALCERVLVALAESGDAFPIEAAVEAKGARPAVTLHYRRGGRSEHISCGYAGGSFERGRLKLMGVRSSELGNLGPVAMRVLKRRLNL